MASLSLVQGRAEVGGSRTKDKPPRPDLSERLSPEDVRLLAINALGLEIRVKAPPRRRTTIDALVMEPMGRNVQRPSRDAAPVTQRPSTEELVAELEDMKVGDVATKELAAPEDADDDESLEDKFEKKNKKAKTMQMQMTTSSQRLPIAPPPGESLSKKAHAEP